MELGTVIDFSTNKTLRIKTIMGSSGVLSGVVTNADGLPEPNIEIIVKHENSFSGEFLRTKTRADGSYALSLPQATYITVTFVDYTPSRHIICEAIPVVTDGITTLNVNIDGDISSACSLIVPPL